MQSVRGAESLGAAAGASTIHAELRRGSCRNSVQPAAGGGYAKPADTLLHDCRISVSKG